MSYEFDAHNQSVSGAVNALFEDPYVSATEVPVVLPDLPAHPEFGNGWFDPNKTDLYTDKYISERAGSAVIRQAGNEYEVDIITENGVRRVVGPNKGDLMFVLDAQGVTINDLTPRKNTPKAPPAYEAGSYTHGDPEESPVSYPLHTAVSRSQAAVTQELPAVTQHQPDTYGMSALWPVQDMDREASQQITIQDKPDELRIDALQNIVADIKELSANDNQAQPPVVAETPWISEDYANAVAPYRVGEITIAEGELRHASRPTEDSSRWSGAIEFPVMVNTEHGTRTFMTQNPDKLVNALKQKGYFIAGADLTPQQARNSAQPTIELPLQTRTTDAVQYKGPEAATTLLDEFFAIGQAFQRVDLYKLRRRLNREEFTALPGLLKKLHDVESISPLYRGDALPQTAYFFDEPESNILRAAFNKLLDKLNWGDEKTLHREVMRNGQNSTDLEKCRTDVQTAQRALHESALLTPEVTTIQRAAALVKQAATTAKNVAMEHVGRFTNGVRTAANKVKTALAHIRQKRTARSYQRLFS